MQRRYASRGFTLIELLVVITIISVMLGAVVLRIEFGNASKIVQNSAHRTGLLMTLAADQAVYTRQQMGIRFHPTSYEFYILSLNEKGEGSWQIIEDERLKFRQEKIPLEFQVDISGLPIVLEELADEIKEATDEDPLKPHVMFLSNGEMFPDFRIVVADEEGEFRHQIATGEVEPVVVESLN